MQNKRTKSGYQVQCDEPRIRDLLQDMLYPITLANAVLFVGVGLFDFGSTRYHKLLSICPRCWNHRRTFAPATSLKSSSKVTTELFRQFNRVTYQVINDIWQWADIVTSINETGLNQGLIIVNTTQLATEGYQILSEQVPGTWFHLSSRMCPAHRSQILTEVRQLLKEGKSCFLISTQVVEAGVDVDFPVVYRQLAPLDSIIQAAGRCNREGKSDNGQVIIFNMQCQNPPGYIYPINITKKILAKYDLNSDILPIIEMYFRTLFNQNHDGGADIQNLRKNYDFPKVAKEVKVIDDEYQVSVVVKWKDGERLIEDMKNKEYLTESDWRKLQQFTVNIPKKFQNYIKMGKIDVWVGVYQETGIVE